MPFNVHYSTLIPKLRLNYFKTWGKIVRLLRKPERIRLAPTPAHLVDALAPQNGEAAADAR